VLAGLHLRTRTGGDPTSICSQVNVEGAFGRGIIRRHHRLNVRLVPSLGMYLPQASSGCISRDIEAEQTISKIEKRMKKSNLSE
jgi:hypothetical protein